MRLLVTCLVGVCLMCAVWDNAVAAPALISYQGRLENLTPEQTGQPLTLVFRIYDGPLPGASKLYEQTIEDVPVDSEGGFNVILGDQDDAETPLSEALDGESRYMSVAVDGGDELPRQQVLSVPYAMQAGQSKNAKNADEASVADSARDVELGTENVSVVARPFNNQTYSGVVNPILNGDGSRWEAAITATGLRPVLVNITLGKVEENGSSFSVIGLQRQSGESIVSLGSQSFGISGQSNFPVSLTVLDFPPAGIVSYFAYAQMNGGDSIKIGGTGRISAVELYH